MAQPLVASSSASMMTGSARWSMLMLTPDEGHLDRRIVQEAATLGRHGWGVDIFPAVDPGLQYGGPLGSGVRLLANPRRPSLPPGLRKRTLRRAKRALSRRFPPLVRLVEAVQYQRRDIAGEITAANLDYLAAQPPYDVVTAHDVPVMPLAMRLARRWDAALVSDLHEVFPEQDEHFTSSTARRYWRRLERDGIAASDAVVCVNEAVADYVRSTYGPSPPLTVVHNSVPFAERSALSAATSLRSIYAIPDEMRILLFAGSIRPHKGLEVVIEGFARARLEGWALAIIGDGPLTAELVRLSERRGVADRVFLGRRVAEHELIGTASSADAALLPYQEVGFNYRIATPNKLFEYIQARLPIATSRLPEIERIVAPLATAGFVDFSTPASTAAGLRDFVVRTLPTVEPVALDAAARRWSWGAEEPRLLACVDAVIAAASSRRQTGPLGANAGSG